MVTYNQHWTPSETDFNTLKWLLERVTTAEDFCRPYFDRAKRYYRLWRFGSAVDEADWPYVNRVRSRDILAFVEDSTALLIQTLFAQMPFFAVEPRETRMLYMNYEGIDPMLIGDQLSRCLDYQISHEDTEFFDEMVDCLKGGCIFGNGYEGVYPKFDSQGNYLRPLLKTTDYWDILPIPGGRRITKSLGVFVRDFTTLEQLQREAKQGFYKNVEYIKGPEGEANADIEWHRNLLQEVGMEDYVPGDIGSIELLHYFSGGHVITFANRKVILRNSNERAQGEEGSYQAKIYKPYPYDMPIVQYKYMPVPLEFFAMGIPEVLEVLQEDKNLIRSARRDNIDLVIQTVLKARSGADINFDLIKFYPGAIWPLENLNDIQEMQIKDVTQNAYQEEAMRTQDMENALSLFGYARGMTPQHCVDDQTEILTDEGWKFFKDLNRREKVLTVNLKTKKYEWQIPTNYIIQDYEGWMIKGKNHNINFKVSPNHKMIVSNQKGEYRLTEFSDIKAGDRIPRVYEWDGESPSEIDVVYKGKHEFINTKDWMAFIGIFIAEGHARILHRNSYHIEIAQFDIKKRKEIKELLDRLPFKYFERDKGFYIYEKDLCLWLIDNIGKKENKHIPKEFKNLCPELLSELFYWMMLGDGTQGKTKIRGKVYPRQTYTTNSKRLADDIQEIILKIGKNATIHYRPARKVFDKKQNKTYQCKEEYDITILHSKSVNGFKSKTHKYNMIWYSGKIYCVEENKNKTMVTRRNGQTLITGRSEQPTTVIKLQQASLNRLDLSIKLTEFGFLQNIATRIILLTRRFMSQANYEAIIGDQDAGFYKLSEEDIRRFYHFRPVGSTVTRVKEVRQQQIQSAMSLTMGIPPQTMAMNVEPFTVNYYELLKTAYDAIDIKNVDRILIKLQQQQQPMANPMEGVGNPSEMQALGNVMYGEGGGLKDIMNQITKATTAPPKPPAGR